MADLASWGFEEGAPIADGREVLKTLGGGNRFEVALVWDEHLFSLAVAKILRPDQASDEKALRELRREWEILERIAHPVIVRGFDAVLDGEPPHVLIEHLEGPSLRRLLRRGGPLPLQQLLPLALHVAGALQYLANEGVVHLDVKPDNVVMGVPPRHDAEHGAEQHGDQRHRHRHPDGQRPDGHHPGHRRVEHGHQRHGDRHPHRRVAALTNTVGRGEGRARRPALCLPT